MSILANFGCSQSTDPSTISPRWEFLKDLIEPSWPQRVASMLGYEQRDHAAPALSNSEIFRAASKYLLLTPDLEDTTMLVQWTELKRYNTVDANHWNTFKLDQPKPSLWHFRRTEDPHQRHPEFLPNQELIIVQSLILQEMAKTRGVDIYFISMVDLSGVISTKLFNQLDHTRWLHSTYAHGWLNHIMWTFGEGWHAEPESTGDNLGHMGEQAVDYTAKCMYNLITTGKQISMEDENWLTVNNRKPLVYRYHNEED